LDPHWAAFIARLIQLHFPQSEAESDLAKAAIELRPRPLPTGAYFQTCDSVAARYWLTGQITAWATITVSPLNVTDGDP
jgi:hypothetical protein